MKPAIIISGGAGNIPDERVPPIEKVMREIVRTCYEMLDKGATAIDAVVKAISMMEDDEHFNAGRGSVLTEEGIVEMDAIVMDGATMEFGAVASVKTVKNPVRLARHIMENFRYKFFTGDGAEKIAREAGLEIVENNYFITERQKKRWNEAMKKLEEKKENEIDYNAHDTVCAVAIDKNGNVAAATSTGGLFMKKKGRVGDTPVIGGGGYADNSGGGASATGIGETLMKVCITKTTTDLMANGLDAMAAAKKAVEILGKKVSGEGGVITIDRNGNVGFAFNTKSMAIAWKNEKEENFLHKL